MEQERTKDVTIDGKKYQLSKMTAMVASRIHNWLVTASIKFQAEQQNITTPAAEEEALHEEERKKDPQKAAAATVAMLWLLSSSTLSEEACTKIQNYALRSCSLYPDDGVGMPSPIMLADGRWAVKALETDATAVNQLVIESLQFNISPFFRVRVSSGPTNTSQ